MRLFILCIVFMATSLSAYTKENTNITNKTWVIGLGQGDLSHLSQELELVGKSAVSSLRGYDLVKGSPTNKRAKLSVIIKEAYKSRIRTLVVLELKKRKRKRAIISYNFYNVKTGSSFYRYSKEYKYKSERALLAQLEYNLPHKMKQDLRLQGRVVQKESNLVYIDLGTSAGTKVGQVYRIFREGKEIENDSGESFGFLDEETGIATIKSTSSVYSIAEIQLGRSSIKKGDRVELSDETADFYKGKVLSKLDNQVAINLGNNVGVSEGAYFAIFKDVKSIKNGESFQEMIGQIRITEVFDEFSKGEIAASNHYSLAKAMIQEGDSIEEVKAKGLIQLSFGQLSTGMLKEASQVYLIGVDVSSLSNRGLTYRGKLGYGDEAYASIGIAANLSNSESFRYGLDLVRLESSGANMFLQVDVPTPLSKYGTFSMETGYLVGVEEEYEGLNILLNLKFSL